MYFWKNPSVSSISISFNGKFNRRHCYSTLLEFINNSQNSIKDDTYDYSPDLNIKIAEYCVSNIVE